MTSPAIARAWAMPDANTFTVAPIAAFVKRYLASSSCSIDPFARNNAWATFTNDLDPATSAQRHLCAEQFLAELRLEGVRADLGIFDPPYSPRQISELYKAVGRTVTASDTQNAAFAKRVRDAMDELIQPGGIVLSFGWNSSGMGRKRGYEIIEILMVAHGSAHNDTICMAEQKARAA